jgi:hypothetical protein
LGSRRLDDKAPVAGKDRSGTKPNEAGERFEAEAGKAGIKD